MAGDITAVFAATLTVTAAASHDAMNTGKVTAAVEDAGNTSNAPAC
jgi:hypothetical protein